MLCGQNNRIFITTENTNTFVVIIVLMVKTKIFIYLVKDCFVCNDIYDIKDVYRGLI